jgi:hypothetical protein
VHNRVVVFRDVFDDLLAMFFVEFRRESRKFYRDANRRMCGEVFRVPKFFQRQRFVFRA